MGSNSVPHVGIGMGLRSRADGMLEVTEVVPGGPVDQVSKVRLGDVLKSVGGTRVGPSVSSARSWPLCKHAHACVVRESASFVMCTMVRLSVIPQESAAWPARFKS